MMEKIQKLDEAVLEFLEFVSSVKLPNLNSILKLKSPLVVGSGNAYWVGKILFKERLAFFADESDFLEKLKIFKPKNVVIISASGKKHSSQISKKAKKKARVFLLTNSKDSPAARFANKVIVFPKIREPYTYNVSTYFSMIFSKTHEDPKKIIASIKKMKIPKFSKFSSFYFVVPEKFKEAPAMILTKFDELFGPMLNARSHTFEATKHAKTLVQSKKEIFLGIGTRKPAGVANFRKFDLTPKADFGEFLSKAYYIIGKIQRENPPYFEKNLENYCRIASRLFGQKISPIVE